MEGQGDLMSTTKVELGGGFEVEITTREDSSFATWSFRDLASTVQMNAALTAEELDELGFACLAAASEIRGGR